jgi:glycosyltransferase involved in cell wall biosynthesis
MRSSKRVSVIIPALNEAQAIGHVLKHIPAWVDDIIVADNGSTDETSAVAIASGARTIHEPRRGYGAACQAGMRILRATDIVVFLDADFSDDPTEMASLVDPIAFAEKDFVIGSRVLGVRDKGALLPQQRFGNRLACFLIRQLFGTSYTDLGPFRAIDAKCLSLLQMQDTAFGWTVEMQIKAAQRRLRIAEVPVRYRRRIGQSKISGTIKGSLMAGVTIISVIVRSANPLTAR